MCIAENKGITITDQAANCKAAVEQMQCFA